jgi:hypothetical protein
MNVQIHPEKNEFIAVQDGQGSKLLFPSYFSEKVIVSKEYPKKDNPIPILVQIYIGGLSVIGLYFVYRLLQIRK